MPAQDASRERLERSLQTLLRWGTVLAATTILLGGMRYLLEHGGEAPHYGTFDGEPAELRSLGGIVADASTFDRAG